jgi:uncharacterized Zn finger protein
METEIKQLRCGECGEEDHKIYTKPTGELITECINCKSQSIISITEPKITISNYDGYGTLCKL